VADAWSAIKLQAERGRIEMDICEYESAGTRRRFGARVTRTVSSMALVVLALLATLAFASSALAAQAPVPLGTAGSFGALSATGVSTGGGGTVINGDLGSAGAITGPFVVTGTNYGGAGLTPGAQADLGIAYNFAAAAGMTASVSTLGGGQTLTAGVYNSASTIDVTGLLTLNGGPDDVFIFQAGSGLTVNPGSSVTLSGGAQACNVFWQVGSSATLNNGGSTFTGTVLASASITVTAAGVTIDGRLLAQTGDVTFISSVVNRPSCAAAPTAQPPGREIYCDAGGQSYDLVKGQDKQAPYDTLGLVPASVDPVTGSKSCAAMPVVPTPVAPAPVAPTPVVPTPVVPTPVAPKPVAPKPVAPKPVASPKKAKAGAFLPKKVVTRATRAVKASVTSVKKSAPGAPAKKGRGGFTG
jgi:hypothetical protein